MQVLVNNAGLSVPPSRTEIVETWPQVSLDSTEHTRKDFEEVFAVNLFGIVDTISVCLHLPHSIP